jgi:uncharacterized protein (TIGR03435 family)
MGKSFACILALHLLLIASLCAQSSGRFDAVSIRPNRSGLPNSDTSTSPGRLSLINVTARSLLLRAFGVQESQIIGAPGWVATERYDVIAVTGGADRLTDKERQPFLQAMLAERWNLRFHRETRRMEVYSLRVDKNGPKFGTYTGIGDYAMKVTAADGRRTLRSTKGNIPRLVEILSGALGKIVANDTALTGEYDFTLEWVQDVDSEAAGPSLTSALREQLGLRLEPVRRAIEVIVVDRIDRPSGN